MTQEEIAKVEAQIAGWYWQPDTWHRKSFVRYFESVPVAPDMLRLLIEYLKNQEMTAVDLLGKSVDLGGATWKATDAWYQTAAGDRWEGTQSEKVRIYQRVGDKNAEDDGPYSVENGCQYAVTHEFFWDVAEVPTLHASSSGVNYTLQGVTRDKETGLYSCVIERRERVQQDVALYNQQGSVFETVQEEQHLGVKQADVAGTGLAQSAGGGVIVTRRIQKNPDCTSDVINTKTTEKSVKNTTVVIEKTLRVVRKTTANRNQTSALSESGLVVGERRTSKITEGGRYDTEVSVVTPSTVGEISSDCQRDVFAHTDSTVVNQTKAPTKDAPNPGNGKTYQRSIRKTEENTFDVTDSVKEEQNVPNAVVVVRKTLRGSVKTVTDRAAAAQLAQTGLVVGETRRSEMTPGGLWDNTTETPIVEPAGKIGESCERQTSVHTHATTTNAAQKPSPIEQTPSPGVVVRRQAQKNEQGTWDYTDTTVEYAERTARGQGGTKLSPTTVSVRHDTLSASPQNTPDVNKDVSFDVSPTERGTYNVREVVTTHLPASAQAIFGSAAVVVTAKILRNETDQSISDLPAVNRSIDASVQPNEHGSFDKTIRISEYSKVQAIAVSSWATERVNVTTTRHNPDTRPQVSMGEASSDPDDNGAASTRVAEYTPIPVDSGWRTWTSTNKVENGVYHYKHGLRIFKNLSAPPTPPSGSHCNLNANINKFGRYDGTIVYTDLTDWQRNTGGGGTYGGIQHGQAKIYQYKHDAQGKSWRRLVTVNTVTYYGSGNEGSENAQRANCTFVQGLSLPERTYATSAPSEGQWQSSN